jgi:hypothetical protein
MDILAERFYNIDCEITGLNKKLKLLKEEKDTIGTKLLELMNKDKIDTIKIKEKCICKKTQNTPECLNESYLHESLSSFFDSTVKERDNNRYAESAVNFILENRQKNEKQVIKLLKSKN